MFIEGNLNIRPWLPADVESLFACVSACREELSTWLAWCPPGYAPAQAESWITFSRSAWEAGSDYNFVVLLDGQVVGGVGLSQTSRVHRVGEIGYWLSPQGRGRGIATRATQWVARYGLSELLLNRVELLVAVENAASQRVCERAGATLEGVLRRRILLRDQCLDAKVYSYTQDDLRVLPRMPLEAP